MAELSRLAVLGAGHVGPVIARLAIKAGYPVDIATSGDPDDIALITELVIPGAQPRWASDAVADADIVVLAIPLHRFLDIDPALLDGKLVVDAMNYWPVSDGVLEPFEGRGSSEVVARRLAGSAVVKALNHIGYHELEDRARPAGAPDRRAAGVAGDDPEAVATIAGLVDRIGYDPVRLESLRAGRVLQPGGPVFGVVLTQPEFEQAVRAGRQEPHMTYTFGLDTFGDRNSDADGKPASHAQTIRNVVEEGVFAEQAGVDFFGIGEHHTEYFPMPAGDVVLAAIAARTMTNPPRLRRHRAELRRSGPGVPAVLHTERDLRRPGRSHPRPRIEHRIVPAVRLRPRRLRGTLRREGHAVRRTAQGRARHLGGQDPRAPAEPGRGAAPRVRARSRRGSVSGATRSR